MVQKMSLLLKICEIQICFELRKPMNILKNFTVQICEWFSFTIVIKPEIMLSYSQTPVIMFILLDWVAFYKNCWQFIICSFIRDGFAILSYYLPSIITMYLNLVEPSDIVSFVACNSDSLWNNPGRKF